MAAGPHVVVDAVAPRPPSAGVSLQEVATPGPSSEAVPRWGNGVKWRPYTVGGVGGVYDPCNASTLTPGTLAGAQTGDPFAIWEAEACSAIGDERLIAAERAAVLLEATTSKRVARELWRGDIAVASGFSNRRLNNPTAAGNLGKINAGAAVNRVAAFAALEQSIGEQGPGAQGFIHCTKRTAAFWSNDQLIHRVGNRLVSEQGTVIIADAGYDGSLFTGGSSQVPAANGTQAWAYATGPVRLWLTDVETQGGGQWPHEVSDMNENPLAEVVDRTANLLTVRAYRYALATFDSPVHVGVLVDHTNASTNNAQTT